MKRDFKMKSGLYLNAADPIISITGDGPRTFIWVGNNETKNKACYATLSGLKTLENLACIILDAIGHNSASIKKTVNSKRKPVKKSKK